MADPAVFRGLRGTNDWVADARPKSFREGIKFLNPRGDTIITGLTTLMDSEKVDDPQFYWWTETLARQGGAVVAGEIYTDATMGSAYTSGGVAGTALFVKVAEAVAKFFRPGHTAILRVSGYMIADTFCKVVGVTLSGAASQIAVRLLEADDNGASVSKNISDVNTILVNGNVNPENGEVVPSLTTDPTKLTNYTQIFKTSLDISRTAMRTRLRTGSSYLTAKNRCLLYHGLEMEKAFLSVNVPTENSGGPNTKPERTTGGIPYYIREYAPGNFTSYHLDTTYTGQTWATGGRAWLSQQIRNLQMYDSGDTLWLCGGGAISAINDLAYAGGHINLQPGTTSYGLKVMQWISPWGTFNLKQHPLMNLETTTQNSILVIRPAQLKYRYVDDTFFKEDNSWKEGGATSQDGKVEEFVTECGLEIEHPETFAYWNGLGTDNALS